MSKKKPPAAEAAEPVAEAADAPKKAARPKRERAVVTVDAAGLLPRSRFDVGTYVAMNRAELKAAPYNPRTIDPDARRRLEASIKEDGLLGGLVWNKRTGNIVGGHQRLDAMDQLHEGPNYSVTVAVIDVDPAREKAINVKLNAQSLQGMYDVAKLTDLLHEITGEGGIELESTGMDAFELQQMGVVDEMLLGYGQETTEGLKTLNDIAEIDAIKGSKAKHKQKEHAKVNQAVGGQIVLTFDNDDDLKAAMEALGRGADDDAFVPGWRFLKRIGVKTQKELAAAREEKA